MPRPNELPPYSAADDALILRLYHEKPKGYAVEAGKLLGRSPANIRHHMTALRGRAGFVQKSMDVQDNRMTLEFEPTKQVKSLQDLLTVAGVDLNVWEVERHIINKYEMGSIPRATGSDDIGWRRDSSTPVITPLWQVKVWLVKKPTALASHLFEKLLEDIKQVRKQPAAPLFLRRKPDEDKWLFEFTPFDLHMGKYAWAEETVTNYDVDIAETLFNTALEELLNKAMAHCDGKLDRILCVFGNDASHIDSKKHETTAGTGMDFDTRYIRVYRRLAAMHRQSLTRLRDIAPVDVKIVPGNHDELTSFHLGEFLNAYFHADKYVKIDNTAKLRKYYDYGINLFGFAHGDKERVTELPLLMAREEPDLWARCSSREWHVGHKHIEEKWELKPLRKQGKTPSQMDQDLFSDKGVRIRRLASLSAHDNWHTQHAYTDRRACDSFIFHKEAGFSAHLSFNVDHFTGKALHT